jgi:hypothetical protein
MTEHPDFICGDIRLEWDWVKPAIESILQEQPLLTYRPEDVYANCVNGSAILMVVEKTRFVVAETIIDPFTHKKTLNIWVAWVAPEHRTGGNTETYLPFFENMALDLGCTYLECSTNKESLGRLYSSIGWALKTQVYVRDLRDLGE